MFEVQSVTSNVREIRRERYRTGCRASDGVVQFTYQRLAGLIDFIVDGVVCAFPETDRPGALGDRLAEPDDAGRDEPQGSRQRQAALVLP